MLNIDQLNKKYKGTILIVPNNYKKAILFKSLKEKKILLFKLLNELDAVNFFLGDIKKTSKAYIYTKNKNFAYSEVLYKNIKYFKNSPQNELYNELVENDFVIESKNKNNKKIYSWFMNLDYLNIEYEKIKFNEKSNPILVHEFEKKEYEIGEVLNLIGDKKAIIYTPKEYHDSIKIIAKTYNISVTTYNKKQNDRINIENEYIEFKNEKWFEEFIEKEIDYVTTDIKEGTVELREISEYQFESNENIYVIGYNSKFFKFKQDDEFISDKDCKNFTLPSSKEKNIDLLNMYTNILEDIISKKIYVSYAKDSGTQVDKICNKFKYKIKDIEYQNNRFSRSFDKYMYKNEIDLFEKTNFKSREFHYFKNNLKLDKFNNNVSGKINYNSSNINISASLLKTYYECDYKFYVQKILKISDGNANQFAKDLGTYIHKILEIFIGKEIKISDINSYFKTECDMYFSDTHELQKEYYINKINEYIYELLIQIKEQMKLEEFVIESVEKKIQYSKNEFIVKGMIDLVLKKDNKYMVIDYKTGSDGDILKFDENSLNLGIDLQNILYFNLLKSKSNIDIAGTYRYKIKPKFRTKSTEIENSKLRRGYTSSNAIGDIDSSNYVKNNNKMIFLENEKFEEYINIVSAKIDEFILNMQNKKAIEIIPLGEKIDKLDIDDKIKKNLKDKTKNICEYCPYKDICYKEIK